MRKSFIILLVFSTILGNAAITLHGQSAGGWTASPETVRRLSENQPQFNYYEEKVPSFNLPELLVSISGKKIRNVKQWEKIRRPELMELFRTNVYGRVPSTPYSQTFKIIKTDTVAMGGTATLKQVEISIESDVKSLSIHLTMFTPNNAKGPSPLFLLIDNRGPANTDPARQTKSEFWPAEQIIARGYAVAVFNNADLDPDNFDDFKNGIHGVLDTGIRTPDSWGAIAAWAWGASRCMDYLETDSSVDKSKIAVVGHSRGGKTALWAGAEDQRFSLVIGNESGCGGAALARRKYGETIERINTSFPHWFCTNYRQYSNNENSMPLDMHMLLALIAPRALYIDAAADDLWGDPKGCYLALCYAMPVFKIYKAGTSLTNEVPPLNKQVINGNVGFHIREGAHNMLLKDWNNFLDFADVVWKKTK